MQVQERSSGARHVAATKASQHLLVADEGCEHEATEAVEDVDVRRNVLGAHILQDLSNSRPDKMHHELNTTHQGVRLAFINYRGVLEVQHIRQRDAN